MREAMNTALHARILVGGQVQGFKEAAASQEVWIHEIQSQLVRLSTRSRQIVADNSDHGIPEKAPATVILAIEES